MTVLHSRRIAARSAPSSGTKEFGIPTVLDAKRGIRMADSLFVPVVQTTNFGDSDNAGERLYRRER